MSETVGYQWCFYQLQKPFHAGTIVADETWRTPIVGYDNVPCIVQARFNGVSPGAGEIWLATSLWDGAVMRAGVTIIARSNLEVARDYAFGLDSGFSIELEQGCGRELIIVNDLDQNIDNLVVWISKKTSTSVAESNVKGRK